MQAQSRVWLPTRRIVLWLWVVGLILGCTDAARVSEPVDPSSVVELEVDRERGEVRIPCRFINPTHVLEVFATHHRGPTHETVLEFDAEGPEIQAALVALGCRPAGFWNITTPDDFVMTQGDRLLVIVRWKWKQQIHEYAAEAILQDGDFGFPAFVRGFSFGARTEPQAQGDPGTEKRPAVPQVIEVTLGGTTRRSSEYSLLWHPTTSPPLEPWMLAPAVNPAVVKDLPQLVAEHAPATLVLRRLKSESDLIEYLRANAATRNLIERQPLYDAMAPVAAQIDGFKAELVQTAAELARLVDGDRGDEPGGGEAGRRRKLVRLRARGRLLVEQIQAGYLELYDLQENVKVQWVGQREDLESELKEFVISQVRDGFSYELRAARHRVTIARLLSEGLEPEHPRVLAATKDLAVLHKDRHSRLNERELRNDQRRLEEAKKAEGVEGFLPRLLTLDVKGRTVLARQLNAERRLLELEAKELRAMDSGENEAALAARETQSVVMLELKVIAVEQKLVELAGEVRWANLDLESQDPQIRRDARQELLDHEKTKVKLDAELKAAQKALDSASLFEHRTSK